MPDKNTADKNTPVVAFIGLGSMGLGMAKNLLKHGHTVIGVDPSAPAREAFAAAGGSIAATPAEAAATADVVAIAVVNAQQVETVLFGDGGATGSLRKGGVVMQSATVPAAFARTLGERLVKSGHILLDAPMSGGIARAQSGELTYMASGSPQAFAAAESILAATSAKVFRLGEAPGIGSLVKTVNQLLAGVHIAAAAEAMALAAKAGADTRAVFDVISASAGNSWMFGNRVPRMLDGDYTPTSANEIFVKDLALVLATGHELRLPLPLAAAAHQLFLAAAGAGWGKLDDASVVKVYEQAGDFKVSSPRR
jgi:3-hydroxyisobutyrate dehydrogenase